MTSLDVNDYVRETTGGSFTAKDYRTWAATMAAAVLLCALDHPGTQRPMLSPLVPSGNG